MQTASFVILEYAYATKMATAILRWRIPESQAVQKAKGSEIQAFATS